MIIDSSKIGVTFVKVFLIEFITLGVVIFLLSVVKI